MKIINSSENNRKIELNSTIDIEVAKTIKQRYPNLPFCIEGQSIVFDQYTVGSLCLGQTMINITTRNKEFTLDKVLQMMLYNQGVKSDFSFTELGESKNGFSGINIIPNVFIESVQKLTSKGLTGGYKKLFNYGSKIKGEIVISKFNKKLIPYKGLPFKEEIYTEDVFKNQVIKSALEKCLLISNSKSASIIQKLLCFFSSVSLLSESEKTNVSNDYIIDKYNIYYPESVRLAIMILNDLQISTGELGIKWAAFLANSNDLFEKFARNILCNNLQEKVEKWENPKKFASVYCDKMYSYKFYVPDILIGYNSTRNSTLAVLDAKNKFFEPTGFDANSMVASADLYELMFYMRQLKTTIGGLIYPTSKRVLPIKVNAIDNCDVNVSLISIDLSSSITQIEKNLTDDVTKTVLKYT
jgi:5-methylcytosine-specific restriction endonuclease McrBC regulatory subunit McrC